MKKTVALILLVMSLILAFTACGKKNKDDVTENPGTEDNVPENPGTNDPKPKPVVTYTVTWVDENGQTLTTQTVNEGTVPAYTYNVQDTAEWDYTFNGWATTAGGEALSAIPAATANATYHALVSGIKQVYTVSFNTMGGSEIASQSVEYGSKATQPEAPTLDGHRFVGWSTSQNEVVEVDFEQAITGNTVYYAVWNETVDIKGLLSALLNGYQLNPYEYLPEAMRLDYSANLVDAEDIVTDYSSFVNVSDITYGFGEQWYMVLTNIDQSMVFFNALTVVESLSASSITAFNNYFDKNPQDTANYEFENGEYNITIKYDGEIIYYVVEYTANIPVIGEVTAQIALAMIEETGEKSVRIQLGDANALAYTVREDSYDFAIKYLGVRRAMFSVARDEDGNVSGKIYEYLTVASVETSNAADFYITEDYVSVVGNKADGLLGFSNTICELYDVNTGKMLGYEVNEVVEKLGITINFDTLWFTLDMVDGINSIKYVAATNSSAAKLYVNGLSKEWASKTVGGINFSRRYDIEFRTQYVTSYDPATQEYTVHQIQVPMLFVQEDYYETLADDIKAENKNVTGVEVDISSADLDQLLYDYEVLVPVFNENKNIFTVELILAYIGEKITF